MRDSFLLTWHDLEARPSLLSSKPCMHAVLSRFSQSISDHHSDMRLRSMYGVWVAPPAMAMLAYANLEGLGSFGPVQRLLFCEYPSNLKQRYTYLDQLSHASRLHGTNTKSPPHFVGTPSTVPAVVPI